MNRIISETVANLENLKMRVVLGRVESDLEIEDTLQDAIDSIRNAPLATTLDLTGIQRYWFSGGVRYHRDGRVGFAEPVGNGGTYVNITEEYVKFSDLAKIQNAGQVGGDDDGEPIHQVGWLDPKDPTRIQVTTHYMIRELGNPENWVPLYAPNDGTTQPPTVPQPVHGVPSEQRCKCPRCGSEEIDAMTARTVYDCGSSDYDARPGTFRQSDKCTLLTGRQEGR